MITPEDVQELLLSLLDKNAIILDTVDLAIDGEHVDQTIISNLLKSLANLHVTSNFTRKLFLANPAVLRFCRTILLNGKNGN